MKRDVTQTIWRTVVFAGAMLGAPACGGKKPASTTPSNTAASGSAVEQTPATDGTAQTPAPPASGDSSADPCGGERPRGADDDGGGGMGRGFVLS